MLLPLVFLLDLDNTIIGDASSQVCRYEISKYTKTKHDTAELTYELQSGLLRPHFESFIKYVKTRYDGVEIYIFTAAERKWANVIISVLEKHLDIKFNRPIFSREYCVPENGILQKQIGKIAPKLYRCLKSKYGLTHISQLKKQVVLIDNNVVINDHDLHRFIKCPNYDYYVPCDVLMGVSKRSIQKYIQNVGAILSKYGIIQGSPNGTDYQRLLSHYYNNVSDIFKQGASQANKNRKDIDNFWLTVERIFRNHNIKSFNTKVVSYINKNVGI